VREECALVVRPTWFVGRATDLVDAPAERACFVKASHFMAAEITGRAGSDSGEHDVQWVPAADAADDRHRHGRQLRTHAERLKTRTCKGE
jgi:hypothetical protein